MLLEFITYLPFKNKKMSKERNGKNIWAFFQPRHIKLLQGIFKRYLAANHMIKKFS